jgi:signal transduction histidine kinase
MNASYLYDEHMVQIQVEDTGVGINKENLKRLFCLFGKGSDIAVGINDHGIGLGLYICQQLVKQHNGNIWVDSKENVGSVFTFTMKIPKYKT